MTRRYDLGSIMMIDKLPKNGGKRIQQNGDFWKLDGSIIHWKDKTNKRLPRLTYEQEKGNGIMMTI